jgi:TolB-like protein
MVTRFMARAALFALALLALGAGGCAYRAGFSERRIPGGYELIAVPVFKNNTVEAGAEVYFTNSIIREIERAKLARVVAKVAAQATLLGTLEKVEYVAGSPTKADPSNQSNFLPEGTVLNAEYRVLTTVRLNLVRNSDQKPIWSGSFQGERSYQTPRIGFTSLNTANALYNHSAHYQALQAMALDMMAEAHDRMTENF